MDNILYAIVKINSEWDLIACKKSKSVNEVHEKLVANGFNNDCYILSSNKTSIFRIKKGNLQSMMQQIRYPFLTSLFIHDKFGKNLEYAIYPKLEKYSNRFYLNINKDINHHLITKYKYYIHWEIFNELFTTLKSDGVVKYMDWCCNLIKLGLLKTEDFEKTSNSLRIFNIPKIKAKIKRIDPTLVDIKNFKNGNKLYEFLIDNNLYEIRESRKDLIEDRTIFEDNYHIVVEVLNHEESIELGTGTNWCTAKKSERSLSYYNDYTNNDEQKLIIIFDKNDLKEKWQFAPYEGDFLDKNDDEFEIQDTFSDKLLKFLIVEHNLRDVNTLLYFENEDINYSEKVKSIIEDELISNPNDGFESENIQNILNHKYDYKYFEEILSYVNKDISKQSIENLLEFVKNSNGFSYIDEILNFINFNNFDVDKHFQYIESYIENLIINNKGSDIINKLILQNNQICRMIICECFYYDEIKPWLSRLIEQSSYNNYDVIEILSQLKNNKNFSKKELVEMLIYHDLENEDEIIDEVNLRETLDEIQNAENNFSIINNLENDDTITIDYEFGRIVIAESYDFEDFDENYEGEMTIKIQNFLIYEEFRQNGYGTKLMQIALDYINEKYNHVEIVWLNASNNNPSEISNDNLELFYNKFGFETILDEGNKIMKLEK